MSFRVTLSSQLEPLREIPVVLENPSVAPAMTEKFMRELPQYIERTRSIMDELWEAEQYADERGIKILPWEVLHQANEVLETATTYISERPN